MVNLRVEKLESPIGIDATSPRFSWQITSDQRALLQTSYQILVAETAEKLAAEKDLTWNSGKREGGISVLIPYEGKPLESAKKYYWKVKVWTNKGEALSSAPAHWSTAFLNNSFSNNAYWIGIDSTMNSGKLTTKTRLSARYLRREFSLNSKIKNARLSISGLGMYECYINGKKISNDIFAPTATDYTKRVNYNVFDVKELLQNNKNTIGVILGNGRYFSMRMANIPGSEPLTVPAVQHYGYPKLLLQLDVEFDNGQRSTVVSDSKWKLTTKGPIIANNEFDGEEYDANLEMQGWNKNGFNDRSWITAKKVGAPEGTLVAQSNPNIKTMKQLKPVSVKQIEKGKYVIDMGQNMVGWMSVRLKGKKGQPVTLRFAETLQKDGNLYTANLRGSRSSDVYTPASNELFSWEPRFVYHGFRYAEVTGIDYLPKAEDFIGKVNYDEMADIGTFETSDTTINQIYRNARWGIMGNYRSMPTDCPQRDERMGWLGDRATGCYAESFMFDNQLFYEKWAQDIHDSQLATGSVPDVAPAYWQMYSDNITWPAAYIHVANMLYEQFGDERPIRLHYQSMKLWLSYMQSRYMKDYIMTKDQYGDWCMPPENLNIIFSKDPARITDGEILSTSFYYKLLNIMAKYAEITSNNNDKKEFLALAEKVKIAYNAKFFQKDKAQYGNNTVTANIVSLMQGLVPQESEKAVFANLSSRIEGEFKSHVSVGLIGIQFLMRGLTANGRPDLAYKIATNRTYPSWGYMIDNGATTIWELWNGNTADPAMNSGNHVMLLGDLLVWYYENLAGIQTDKTEVGFKKIVFKPTFPKGLKYVKASHKSPYGLITSELNKTGNNTSWKVIIPPNTTATVHVPVASFDMIKESGASLKSRPDIQLSSKESGTIALTIQSGEYRFEF
ncbi:MAG TPA: family 78 glycoside hydrolase catalytic domain [Pedobacter sp.]